MAEVTPIKKSRKGAARKKRQNRTKEADRLFSLWVRSVGMCEAGLPDCNGNLQCAHGFSRRYRSTRWDRRNAWALCSKHHFLYTHNPILWDEWLFRQWGAVLYLQMRERAVRGDSPDLDAILERLKVEVPS